MEPTGPAEAGRAAPPERRRRLWLWALVAVVIAFIGGFGWQYVRAAGIERDLAATESELEVLRLRLELAQAAIAAQSGRFEPARQQMSDLFTRLGDLPEDLDPDVAAVLRELLAERDDVITGLSRGNPAAAATLYAFLDRLRTAAGETTPARDGVEAPAAATDTPTTGATP